MALDRFVRWQKETPESEVLRFIAEDFLDGIAKIEKSEDNNYFFISIPGIPSSPLKRVPKFKDLAHIKHINEIYADERWIEVYCHKNYVDVITRFTDPITSTIAKGLSEIYARTFNGIIED